VYPYRSGHNVGVSRDDIRFLRIRNERIH
jgi:hypothetical protein